MIVIADNDLILKLCQCDLIDALPQIIGKPPEQILISPTARYQLLTKTRDKAVSRCGNDETYDRLVSFLDRAVCIPAVNNIELLSTLASIPDIDDGEQLLFAAAVESTDSLIFTGDKRALTALESHANMVDEAYRALLGRTIIFESILLLALQTLGFPVLKQKLLGNPRPDSLLKLVLRADMTQNSLEECLYSYARPLSSFLAFKDRLPLLAGRA